MGSRSAELHTRNFYNWEKLGRGWHVCKASVCLEPEFFPFFRLAIAERPVDDGQRPSYLGLGIKLLADLVIPIQKPVAVDHLEELPVNGYPFQSDEPLQAYSISFPEDYALNPFAGEQLLTMLSACTLPMSFEVVASHSRIRFQFVCRRPDAAQVAGQLAAYFPECFVAEKEAGYLTLVNGSSPGAYVDFGLEQEFMRPIAVPQKSPIDSLTGLFGILEHLGAEDTVVWQTLFQATVNPWAYCIQDSVTDGSGESFFLDAPEMLELAREKVSAPLFGATTRLLVQSPSQHQAQRLLQRLAAAVCRLSQSEANALLPLSVEGYSGETMLKDVEARETHRLGMLLNARELAILVRLPSEAIRSKKLERDMQKTKPAPRIAEGYDFVLGRNLHQGKERYPTLETGQRLKHMHVIGATGTGKSTFLQGCIVQDIMLGNGVAVLDPHGDLIEAILPYIPKERLEDVIIVDPADTEYPVGFNILTAHSDIEKELLASDLVAVFRRLSTSWGDQMHSVLANAILAFLESSRGGTLVDLRRFLIEKPYREEFLKTVSDSGIIYYWQKEYPLLKTNSIGSILTRLDTFLRPKAIRLMVAQQKSLDFEDMLNSRKIVLIKLSQGLIGTENSYLLGTFFVSKIQQAAMARQAQAKGDRKPFYLYIDEFQNFITPSMSSILSGTRKYGLGCVLAHQDMIQLRRQDAELASAVISNAGTRVCFRLGDVDAKQLAEGFASFEAQDLQNLGTGQAIVRIERPEFDCNISTLELKQLPAGLKEEAMQAAIAISRKKYGTPKADVERQLEYLSAEQPKTQIPEQPVVEVPNLIVQQPELHKRQEPDTEPRQEHKAVELHDTGTKEQLVRQKEVTEHRYLQTLIKKMSEQRGYKASIEEPIPDGQERVDVLLERNGRRIACEIGVTTTKEWEVHNIEKCLAAGYEVAVAIASSEKGSAVMQKKIAEHFNTAQRRQILVLPVDSFFNWLDTQIAKEASTEKRVKGYRVKVEYEAVSEKEMQDKKDSISNKIINSLISKDK